MLKKKRHVFQRYWNNVKDKNNAPPAHTQKKTEPRKTKNKKVNLLSRKMLISRHQKERIF